MIKVCFADNQPVVHYGIRSFFKDHSEIKIDAQVGAFDMVEDILKIKPIDILLIDLELEGFDSINQLKKLMKENPSTKVIIFTALSEGIYAPNAIKAGASSFVSKLDKLENLSKVIIRVYKGAIIYNEQVRSNISLILKQNKNDRLYRKLSNREMEVLRYISYGKKNIEISKILDLNEKTISTYKLRLLNKFQVTNVVDLIEKAKKLEIV
ncbi:MAG: LuxR C-terminal-related transcriptional regulator [Flavobacterium sp.]